MHTLKIIDLNVKIDDKQILNNFNLEIKSGETHVIMGPNGTGKSTLSKVIMGDPDYSVISGDILYDDESILPLTVDERARKGIFLTMQSPIEINGVSNADFLRTAVSSKEKEKFKLFKFIKEVENKAEDLKFSKDFISRGLNEGFSGGERKKNEILQMHLLKPDIIMLDEIDSGLDVDSLKVVGENVTNYKKENNAGLLVITHYQRLLDYIKPDYVHIMMNGTIVKSGDKSLVKEVEDYGYSNIKSKKVESIGTCIVKDIIKDE